MNHECDDYHDGYCSTCCRRWAREGQAACPACEPPATDQPELTCSCCGGPVDLDSPYVYCPDCESS